MTGDLGRIGTPWRNHIRQRQAAPGAAGRQQASESGSVPLAWHALADGPDGQPATAGRSPQPVLGVGRDEDDVSRREVGHAPRAVQLHFTFQNDERLRLAGVDVRGHTLVGFGGYLTNAPPSSCSEAEISSRLFDVAPSLNSPSAAPMMRIPSRSRIAVPPLVYGGIRSPNTPWLSQMPAGYQPVLPIRRPRPAPRWDPMREVSGHQMIEACRTAYR